MDPERQPLLQPINQELRIRRYSSRPLTLEEVQLSRSQVGWSRARFVLVFFFWCAMAASLSLAASVLLTSRGCHGDAGAAVPPVHMTLAPLMARSQRANDVYDFMAI